MSSGTHDRKVLKAKEEEEEDEEMAISSSTINSEEICNDQTFLNRHTSYMYSISIYCLQKICQASSPILYRGSM